MTKEIRKPFSLEAYEAGAKVETRDGRAVRILATDYRPDDSDATIIALVSNKGGYENAYSFYKDGSYLCSQIHKLDLVIVKEIEYPTWEDIAEDIRDYDWTINNGHELAFETEEEALAFEALYKLFYLRKVWIGDWKPDWTDGSTKYNILNYRGEIQAGTAVRYSDCLSFPTEKMCDEFLEAFRELIEKARDLI